MELYVLKNEANHFVNIDPENSRIVKKPSVKYDNVRSPSPLYLEKKQGASLAFCEIVRAYEKLIRSFDAQVNGFIYDIETGRVDETITKYIIWLQPICVEESAKLSKFPIENCFDAPVI